VYELHAWFGLAESAEESDAGGLATALAGLVHVLQRFAPQPQVRWMNGQPYLSVDSAGNRPGSTAGALDDLLQFLAERLPGSWGLAYERDDERVEAPGANAFRVRVLARGSVTERDDPFLSPCRPIIDD